MASGKIVKCGSIQSERDISSFIQASAKPTGTDNWKLYAKKVDYIVYLTLQFTATPGATFSNTTLLDLLGTNVSTLHLESAIKAYTENQFYLHPGWGGHAMSADYQMNQLAMVRAPWQGTIYFVPPASVPSEVGVPTVFYTGPTIVYVAANNLPIPQA